MSGGSYNYVCFRLEEECVNRMYDIEMNDMIKDLCKLLHDLEWWQSSDCCEDTYRKTVKDFKLKWFNGKREERLKDYIDENIKICKEQLYELIGLESEE